MRDSLATILVFAALTAGQAHAGTRFDVSDPLAYDAAHRTLAESLRQSLQAKGAEQQALADLVRHGRELPLREVCSRCSSAFASLGVDESYEPGVWLHQPHGGAAAEAGVLIAFPPAGDDGTWQAVDALTPEGAWITLDAHRAPAAPVLVLRINGALSFERQVAKANAMLRDAGLQRESAAATAKGSTPTTRIESIRLNDDEEPWVSGAAEIYAITIGLQPANQPQIGIVEMPYLDHDGRYYYPRQVLLYWQDFAYGAADVLLYEHDDNTNYQTLVQALIGAAGELGDLAGKPELQAIAEIANKIVSAMPSGWFANDDDYVDSFYTVLKTMAEARYGAAGNARMYSIPYQLPTN